MTTTATTWKHARAILTRYLGPTDTRGSRVKATAGGGSSVMVPWDHSLNADDNHAAAAAALAAKLWGGNCQLTGGCCRDGGFAFTVRVGG